MSFSSIFEGDIFTFEIGPEKKPFKVHKTAVERHSPALSTLMNNGNMSESITGVAQLDQTEPQTFLHFIEFIYLGIYRVVQQAVIESSPIVSDQVRKSNFYCRSCYGTFERDVHPTFCPGCSSSYIEIQEIKESKKKQKHSNIKSNNDSTYRGFIELQYPALQKTHGDLSRYLNTLCPPDAVTKTVCEHAKLYVFAQKYLIEELAKLCLHKLHRDLLALQVDEESVPEIIDLMVLSYSNTPSADLNDADNIPDKLPGRELRQLVMSYAICHAKKLTAFVPFQIMLQDGGEIASDFAIGVASRISA